MRQQLQNGTADIEACSKKLQQLKLMQLGTVATAAVPPQGGDVSALLLARTTFETAAMLCVYTLQQQQQQQQQNSEDFQEEMMAETAESFQRHMNMLLPFYSDLAHVLPASEMQLELECLQLLHFLSSDCIAELHVAFDRLSNEARESPYIVSVMRLEQRLMAGDFEAVMQQQQQQQQQQKQQQQQQGLLQLPRSACVFLSQLTKTVRLLIAAALEASYESLPAEYACRALHLPLSALEGFCEEQNRRRRVQGDGDNLLGSPSLELAAAAAADATPPTAPPRLLQQQQHHQPQSASALAAGVGSGSFASAVSFERASPLEVQWSLKGDRVVFAKTKPTTQHCAFHATQVAAHLIGLLCCCCCCCCCRCFCLCVCCLSFHCCNAPVLVCALAWLRLRYRARANRLKPCRLKSRSNSSCTKSCNSSSNSSSSRVRVVSRALRGPGQLMGRAKTT
ncbi:hypothetical protein ACSSS7_005840 [Eimeria intestinalis]